MFLDGVSLDNVKASVIRRNLSNWMKLAGSIYTEASEDDLLVMMKIEKESKNREYILSRLHARYNALRCKREKEELLNGSI